MKIGIDTSRYSHAQATGVEWYSWHIINHILGLIGQDDEVVLYRREPLNQEMRGILGKNVRESVIEAKRLWTLKALSLEMELEPPDVLFVPSHTLPRRLPRRSVIMIHDVAFKHIPGAYDWRQRIYLNWSTKFAVRHASKILVPSEATAKDLQKLFKCPADKIEVILHGFEAPAEVDNAIFETSEALSHFKLSPKSKYLFYVGRLEEKKNLGRLVEAFSRLEDKEMLLVLAGKQGKGFKKLWRLILKLGLADRVIMPGYVTEEEKLLLFKHCQGYVFPSLYEGFGLPILEAFHFGKPVMCSNISSLPEVGGDAVVYVDPHNEASIAEGMEVLIAGGAVVDKLVAAGTERLEKFTWERAARRTLEILKANHGQ
jgi:glycosyltransferase involved in cell wall biosynthesis